MQSFNKMSSHPSDENLESEEFDLQPMNSGYHHPTSETRRSSKLRLVLLVVAAVALFAIGCVTGAMFYPVKSNENVLNSTQESNLKAETTS